MHFKIFPYCQNIVEILCLRKGKWHDVLKEFAFIYCIPWFYEVTFSWLAFLTFWNACSAYLVWMAKASTSVAWFCCWDLCTWSLTVVGSTCLRLFSILYLEKTWKLGIQSMMSMLHALSGPLRERDESLCVLKICLDRRNFPIFLL